MSEPVRPRFVLLAVAIAAVVAVAPLSGLSVAGQYALATMAFAGALWITGALPLPVTALCVPVALVALGVYSDFGDAVAGFADPVIFLLLAGFVLAEAMRARGLDRRVAFRVLALVGRTPRRLVAGVMVATAVLSMVVSNTATTAMMVPIVVGLLAQVTGRSGEDVGTDGGAALATDGGKGDPESASRAGAAGDAPTATDVPNLRASLLLGTAYGASLGGVGTLIGTPPNAIVVSQLRELVGVEITFVDWLAIGLPMVAITLPIGWFLLTYVVYPPEDVDVSAARLAAREHVRSAGPLDTRERRVIAVFLLTAGLWLLGGFEFLLEGLLPAGWHVLLFGGAGGTALGTAGHQGLLYFVLVGLLAVPALVVSGGAMWEEVADVDWGTLILFGGGISLANALADTDATRWLADATVGAFAGAPILVVLAAVIALTVLVGEVASNTAMAAVLAPILITVGPRYAAALGVAEVTAATFLAVTGAIAASYGFALPVATPPNAIVFGAGEVTRGQMLRAGVLLDVVMILVATGSIALLARFVWPAVVG